jgi:hypothetical protein
MNFKVVLLSGLLTFSATSFSAEAPKDMKEFNKTCPAPTLCKQIQQEMETCKTKKSCEAFLTSYKKLLPQYDCQRPFDRTATKNYIVPAIWLCEDHEELLGFLSKMKSKNAQKLFGSSALRSSLDGELAENYKKKSLAVGKKLKK